MLKSIQLLCGLIIMVIVATGLSSCKEDEPPAPPRVSLSSTEPLSVSESVGIIDIEVTLDRAYSKDISIEYTLGGTAIDLATNAAEGDYDVIENAGEVDIDKGETSGIIRIEINNDSRFEENETIVVHLDRVEDEPDLEITNDDEVTITIENDDEKVLASFTNTAISFNEADAVVEIQVPLDRAVGQSATLTYTISGTARDSVTAVAAEPDLPRDYAILGGTPGTVQVSAGATTAIIRARMYTDFYFEEDETIIITLTGGTGIEPGANKVLTITLEQQDGIVAELYWDETYTDVDMDMFMWLGGDANDLSTFDIWAGSLVASYEPPEQIFIPNNLEANTFVGMTYLYYEGTPEPMTFDVLFVNIIDGEPEPEANWQVFSGSYTSANINAWETLDDLDHIEQTFQWTGTEFTNFTAILTPASGSRIKTITSKAARELKKTNERHIVKRLK